MLRFMIGAVFVFVSAIVPAFAQVPSFEAVTDAMLDNPPPESWLNWRRTRDGWGYSPLDQITRDNVDDLRLEWSWAMEAGSQQTTPIVHEGVMYLANPGNLIQALDAATGDLLWEYRRQFPTARGRGRPNRNISIYDDKIILNTADANIVALDARTGEVVWEADVADPDKGFHYTGGSLVADGKVISGMAGCMRFWDDGCFITGHDARTGQELWRTSTVARPGEPGGDTWGDLPMMLRAGGDAWITGSYDAELGLTYWGVAQAKPWSQASRTTDGDALYTSSTLALDPQTGALYWEQPWEVGAGMAIATPFKRGDYLLVSQLYNGSMMMRLNQDRPDATMLWKGAGRSPDDPKGLHSAIMTPLVIGDSIYSRSGGIEC